MPDLWNFTVVMPMPLRPRLPHLNQVLASAGKGSGGDNAGTRELARPTHTLGMQHQPMHLERTGSFKTENSDSETEGGIEVSDLTAALETASAAPAAAPAAAQAQAPWGPAVIRDLPGRKKARKDAAGDDGLDNSMRRGMLNKVPRLLGLVDAAIAAKPLDGSRHSAGGGRERAPKDEDGLDNSMRRGLKSLRGLVDAAISAKPILVSDDKDDSSNHSRLSRRERKLLAARCHSRSPSPSPHKMARKKRRDAYDVEREERAAYGSSYRPREPHPLMEKAAVTHTATVTASGTVEHPVHSTTAKAFAVAMIPP